MFPKYSLLWGVLADLRAISSEKFELFGVSRWSHLLMSIYMCCFFFVSLSWHSLFTCLVILSLLWRICKIRFLGGRVWSMFRSRSWHTFEYFQLHIHIFILTYTNLHLYKLLVVAGCHPINFLPKWLFPTPHNFLVFVIELTFGIEFRKHLVCVKSFVRWYFRYPSAAPARIRLKQTN